MVDRWSGMGQFLSGFMGQLYPGADSSGFANGITVHLLHNLHKVLKENNPFQIC